MDVLRAAQATPRACWDRLWDVSTPFGCSWALSRDAEATLRRLDLLWVLPELSQDTLGPFGEHLGGFMGPSRGVLGPPPGRLDPPWKPWGIRTPWGPLENFWAVSTFGPKTFNWALRRPTFGPARKHLGSGSGPSRLALESCHRPRDPRGLLGEVPPRDIPSPPKIPQGLPRGNPQGSQGSPKTPRTIPGSPKTPPEDVQEPPMTLQARTPVAPSL